MKATELSTCRKGSGQKLHLTPGGSVTLCHSGGQTFARVWSVGRVSIQDAIDRGTLCAKCRRHYSPEIHVEAGSPEALRQDAIEHQLDEITNTETEASTEEAPSTEMDWDDLPAWVQDKVEALHEDGAKAVSIGYDKGLWTLETEVGVYSFDMRETGTEWAYEPKAEEKKVWTKAEIRKMLADDDRWLERGLVAIYRRQTAVEQLAETTIEDNGVGFNGLDAMFLSSVAKQVISGAHMSPKQVVHVRKAMLKYSGQLADIANGRA